MDDPRRRYLQQLIELGEKELVLSEAARGEGPRQGSGRTARPAPAVAPTPLADSPSSASETEQPQRASEGALRAVRPSERAGAATETPMLAPIPTGIIAEAPARGDLFATDPLAALPSLEEIARVVEACRKCGLGYTRLHSVPGQGNPHAGLVVVGEAPGATEDETGLAFVGRAGQLLTDILAAIKLSRDDVFICNVLKCRPPSNRDPEPLEVAACSPYLHRQLELIRPKVILAMGRPAAHALLGTNASLGDLRQKVHRYRGIPLIVTYHPAALLRNPHWKRPTWDDVRLARRIFDDEVV